MVVKKGLLQAPGIFRLVAGAGLFPNWMPFLMSQFETQTRRLQVSGDVLLALGLWAACMMAPHHHLYSRMSGRGQK